MSAMGINEPLLHCLIILIALLNETCDANLVQNLSAAEALTLVLCTANGDLFLAPLQMAALYICGSSVEYSTYTLSFSEHQLSSCL